MKRRFSPGAGFVFGSLGLGALALAAGALVIRARRAQETRRVKSGDFDVKQANATHPPTLTSVGTNVNPALTVDPIAPPPKVHDAIAPLPDLPTPPQKRTNPVSVVPIFYDGLDKTKWENVIQSEEARNAIVVFNDNSGALDKLLEDVYDNNGGEKSRINFSPLSLSGGAGNGNMRSCQGFSYKGAIYTPSCQVVEKNITATAIAGIPTGPFTSEDEARGYAKKAVDHIKRLLNKFPNVDKVIFFAGLYANGSAKPLNLNVIKEIKKANGLLDYNNLKKPAQTDILLGVMTFTPSRSILEALTDELRGIEAWSKR